MRRPIRPARAGRLDRSALLLHAGRSAIHPQAAAPERSHGASGATGGPIAEDLVVPSWSVLSSGVARRSSGARVSGCGQHDGARFDLP
jgi:hypothetical protein